MITVTPVDTTDPDAARELLWRLRIMQPQITQIWADSAYAGQTISTASASISVLSFSSSPLVLS